MRNVFLFIRRYFTFFAFLGLQVVALWFLFTYNRFHRAKGLGWANELTGMINSRYNSVDDFFHLRAENERVHRLNDSLLNLLPANFTRFDTTVVQVRDSIPFDTLGSYRTYLWRPAKVTYSTVNSQQNYIQIDKGSKHGVKDNNSLINSDGSVVGVILIVSPNYATARSLLHVESRISVALKKSGNIGTIHWDGKDPRFLTMDKVTKSDSILVGDTIITSNLTSVFPPGYVVGTIAEILKDKSTTYLTLKVKTAANFFNLEQVHVVEDLYYDEKAKQLEEAKKMIEDRNKKNTP
jgi:rod shape-determining protein MreC